MKNRIKSIICIALFGLILTSCDKDQQSIAPAEISNLRADTRAGEIVLRWDTITDPNVNYVRVSYNDPRTKKDNIRLASIYADSLLIPDTRARYGEYTFTVNTVSYTETMSPEQVIKKTSDPALRTVYYENNQISLVAADLSSNAVEPTEGSLANLLDGNTSTFFHSTWSENSPDVHWLQINLKKEINNMCKFYFYKRNNNNRPINIDLMGSMDGNDWFLIKNFTDAADGLPTASTVNDYTSQPVKSTKPFKQIRLVVNKTNSGTKYFTMSEFKVWEVTEFIIDPEVDETN